MLTREYMNDPVHTMQEKKAAAAFGRQARVFDMMYGADTIINYKRKRVRDHLMRYLSQGSSILELNAGTGADAIFLASKGHHVHATDISGEMLEVLKSKIAGETMKGTLTTEICSFTELENLSNGGPYDFIFSNFAGLNCTNELSKVLDAFNPLLKPGGMVSLVLLPKLCLWEFLLLFKGKFKTAFRRFSGKRGASARISVEGVASHFRCWYYNPSYIKNYLAPSFEMVSLEGLCTMVPPSYMEHFAEKHPRMFRFFVKREERLKFKWPWRVIGDYYIITLRKK
jgi:ubiquinone/menaquinone biosynthesis C-methylase UbiE